MFTAPTTVTFLPTVTRKKKAVVADSGIPQPGLDAVADLPHLDPGLGRQTR
jgi:hypothetical protein